MGSGIGGFGLATCFGVGNGEVLVYIFGDDRREAWTLGWGYTREALNS